MDCLLLKLESNNKQQTVPLILYILEIWMNHCIVLSRNIVCITYVQETLVNSKIFIGPGIFFTAQSTRYEMYCVSSYFLFYLKVLLLCLCTCNVIKSFILSTKLFHLCFPPYLAPWTTERTQVLPKLESSMREGLKPIPVDPVFSNIHSQRCNWLIFMWLMSKSSALKSVQFFKATACDW